MVPDGNKILFNSIPLKIYCDSILNPTKAIPSWKMEKPGFDKTNILLLYGKPNQTDKRSEHILRQTPKIKGVVLNKLIFKVKQIYLRI
jgi:hypothetical protein